MKKSTRNMLILGAIVAVGYYGYTQGWFGNKDEDHSNACGCGA